MSWWERKIYFVNCGYKYVFALLVCINSIIYMCIHSKIALTHHGKPHTNTKYALL